MVNKRTRFSKTENLDKRYISVFEDCRWQGIMKKIIRREHTVASIKFNSKMVSKIVTNLVINTQRITG